MVIEYFVGKAIDMDPIHHLPYIETGYRVNFSSPY
jgi:hypothetical protein